MKSTHKDEKTIPWFSKKKAWMVPRRDEGINSEFSIFHDLEYYGEKLDESYKRIRKEEKEKKETK